jgi:hypothetical protein
MNHRRRIWGVPAVLAIVTMAGLFSALLGDQVIWKAVGWICLIIPIVTAGWFSLRSGTSNTRR